MIEPPVVVRDPVEHGSYLLLDGHLRIDALRSCGTEHVACLIATENEAFTYNKRVSRLTIVQEHRMILNAIRKGVSEERLARALNVNIPSIRAKRNLLVGICPEAAQLLQDKVVPIHVFTELRFLKPLRQIEVAQAMNAMNRYSLPYVRSLVAATPASQLVQKTKARKVGLSEEQISLMQRESEILDREFRLIEKDYSADHLDLTLGLGYVKRLLENVRVVRHLAQHHPEILSEFQKIAVA